VAPCAILTSLKRKRKQKSEIRKRESGTRKWEGAISVLQFSWWVLLEKNYIWKNRRI
jgi:hypothetical protein